MRDPEPRVEAARCLLEEIKEIPASIGFQTLLNVPDEHLPAFQEMAIAIFAYRCVKADIFVSELFGPGWETNPILLGLGLEPKEITRFQMKHGLL